MGFEITPCGKGKLRKLKIQVDLVVDNFIKGQNIKVARI